MNESNSDTDLAHNRGSLERQDVPGLGIRFQRQEDWYLPKNVGLEGHYESLCPYTTNL
jgi:hypothetical protein